MPHWIFPLQPCVQLKTVVKDNMFIWFVFSYVSVTFPTSLMPHVKGLVSFCCLPQFKNNKNYVFGIVIWLNGCYNIGEKNVI